MRFLNIFGIVLIAYIFKLFHLIGYFWISVCIAPPLPLIFSFMTIWHWEAFTHIKCLFEYSNRDIGYQSIELVFLDISYWSIELVLWILILLNFLDKCSWIQYGMFLIPFAQTALLNLFNTHIWSFHLLQTHSIFFLSV